MLSTRITFFPVGNGDMTLIRLSGVVPTSILIDCNLNVDLSSLTDCSYDPVDELYSRLSASGDSWPYVDAFVITHPDQDHCSGIRDYFHLGSPDDYQPKTARGGRSKIIIGELWSSPTVFRRAGKKHRLTEDAKALATEARRRVALAREGKNTRSGDRIRVVGEDQLGKTDDLADILSVMGETITSIDGVNVDSFSALVIGPWAPQDEEEDEEELGKNDSSIILNLSLLTSLGDTSNLLLGGDAEVFIWQKLWEELEDAASRLSYDLLLAPHHCSWHSLSYDSWGKSVRPATNSSAIEALSQARTGASVVASCKPISDDDTDPPCVGARDVYELVASGVGGKFYCTGEYPKKECPQPLEFEITGSGPQRLEKTAGSRVGAAGVAITREPFAHGNSRCHPEE